MKNILIIGAGAWGTALAKSLSSNAEKVFLWAYEKEVVDSINQSHINNLYMPNSVLPNNVQSISDVIPVKDEYNTVIITTPVQIIHHLFSTTDFCLDGKKVLIGSKGIDVEREIFPTEIIAKIASPHGVGVLSGASFAQEVIEDKFTNLVCAYPDLSFAQDFAKFYTSKSLLITATDDVKGAEISGAIKNVIAIATGILEGADMGKNTSAYFFSKGFHETHQLCEMFGGRLETVFSNCGLGDLILTASSKKSRNYQMGFKIGEKGYFDIKDYQTSNGVVEGFHTVKVLVKIAKDQGYDFPICNFVYNICFNGLSVKEAFEQVHKV